MIYRNLYCNINKWSLIFYSANTSLVNKKTFLKSEPKKKFKSLQKEFDSSNEIDLRELVFSDHNLSHAAFSFLP